MQALRFLFSPSGRLSPQVFVVAAIVVYLAGTASHTLTMPTIMARTGPWLFAAVQALLIWIWYVLHAKRLHDAGRSVGPAIGASILYALSITLLLILAVSFYVPLAGQVSDANTASALGLILLISIVAVLLGSAHYDLTWLVVAILVLLSLLPVILAVGVTVFAATRPAGRGTPSMNLYFAYGSNMHRDVMATHAPTAKPVGVGALANHRFVITADGYASVEPKHSQTVYGVLWRIGPRDRVRLDAWENIAGGLYRAKNLPVQYAGRRHSVAYLHCAAAACRTGQGWLYGACDRGGAWSGSCRKRTLHHLRRFLPKRSGRRDVAQS